MAQVRKELTIAAPVDEVWAICGDVAALDRWIDGVDAVQLDGDLRYVTLDKDRGQATERITFHSDQHRRIEYELAGEQLSMRSYSSRFWVEEVDGGSHVCWEAQFEPAAGVAEEAIAEGLEASYENALAGLRRLAEGG